MADNKSVVSCRYPKCSKLHGEGNNKINKSDAFRDDKGRFYHPDCYHVMQKVNQIRDTFIREINPVMTGKQIGAMVSTIHNLIFDKKVDVDLIEFALNYYIKYKPGALKQPFGIHYIVQDKNVLAAWKKHKERKLREEIRDKQENIKIDDEFVMDLPETDNKVVGNNSKQRFSSVLGA